ncbi:MAG: helix-turn-helix transcriptional regulator [Raoultibacter sp.]
MQDAQGVSNAEVARRSGKSRQFITDTYAREDTKVSTACKLAEAMGCELVVRKSGERDGIIVTYDD